MTANRIAGTALGATHRRLLLTDYCSAKAIANEPMQRSASASTPGRIHKMTQPNERVFFDNNGIFISQYRFTTPDGSVYPTRSMQRIWGSVDRKPVSGWLIFLLIILTLGGFVLGILAGSSLLAGVVAMFISAVFCLILFFGFKIGRRRRYWANFTFAGGGVFSGSGSVSGYGAHLYAFGTRAGLLSMEPR